MKTSNHSSTRKARTGDSPAPKRSGKRGKQSALDTLGLNGFARAIGTSPDSVLAVTATMLSGIAGPDSWLQAPWGHRRVPKLDLMMFKADARMQRMVDALTEPLHLMNRRLSQNMGRFDSNAIELLTAGPFSNPAASKHADSDMRDKSLRLHTDALLEAGDSALSGDLSFDPVTQRIEAMKHPRFLIRTPELSAVKSAVEDCHLCCALVVKPTITFDPRMTTPTKLAKSFTALVDGVASRSRAAGRGGGRDSSLSAKAHVILSLSEEELGILYAAEADFTGRFMSVRSGTPEPMKPGDSEASAAFFENFQATAEELLNLRRNGRAPMIHFPDVEVLAQFESELRTYEAEIDKLPVVAGPWARGLPQTVFWSLSFLSRTLPGAGQVDGGELVAAAFAAARSLVESHSDRMLLIANSHKLDERRALAEKIVEVITNSAKPMKFREIVRSFDVQKKERFERVIEVLIETTVLVRDSDGYHAAGPVKLADAAEILDQKYLGP